jgi:nitrate reductase NapAB chaperone NapD
MAIVGAVVVAVKKELEAGLRDRMSSTFEELAVKDIGEKGIAVVIEADNIRRLKNISDEISGWDEVLEFELAYLNWEEAK